MGLWDAWYRAGTADVTNGSATVSGTLTVWSSHVKTGDTFSGPDGLDYEIATVGSNTSLTLATVYAGSNASGASYAIKRYSPAWSVVADLSLKISNFLQTISGVYGGTGAPSDSLGNDGDYYFRDDDPALHKKSSGSWDAGLSLVGPQGPVGPGFSTTSTTSITIGTGAKVFTIPGAGAPYMGARMRAAVTADPTKYLEGVVTATGANSVTITVGSGDTAGSGTYADWSLVVTGNRGATGATGAPNSGTSATSNSVGTGTKTFTVTAGLDLVAGQRVRFADAADPATNWMEGSITAYSGTSLSISSDLVGGSGTKTSWSFGLIGARGPTGATGADSTVPGPSGPGYAATSSTNDVTIGTGTKSLTIGTGYAYQAGVRARASDAADPATNWMEGVVTGYSGGGLEIAADKIAGSGTPASWKISVAGDPGADGADGISPLSEGDYAGGTTYSKGDMARDGGATWQYVNATPGSGNAPPTLPTESNSYWQLVAKDGADGSGAVNSVNGNVGDVSLEAGDIPAEATVSAGYTPSSGNAQGHFEGISAALAAIIGAAFAPAGRLTLTSGTPVLSSGVSGAGTIYYTPYCGAHIPLYDGTNFIPSAFSELSNVLANAATGKAGPAAAAASQNYDLFVWNDSGTLRLTRGPAWTSATSRGTGAGTTELTKVKGYWLNAQAITNGPAAQRGTYVGTIRTNSGAATVDFSFGGSAAGGTAAVLGVWNCYNRVDVTATVQNSTTSWTYNSGTPRQPNGSTAMRASFVSGLAEEAFRASYACLGYATGATDACLIGVMYDVTNAFSGASGYGARGNATSSYASYGQAAIGFHFVAAGEACNQVPSGTNTWYGSGSGAIYANALTFSLKM